MGKEAAQSRHLVPEKLGNAVRAVAKLCWHRPPGGAVSSSPTSADGSKAHCDDICRDLAMDGHFSPAFGQHKATRGGILGMRALPTWKPKAETTAPTSLGAWDGFPPGSEGAGT